MIMRLSDVVLPAYREFWRTEKTYAIVKGSRGSGKSKHAALWHIYNMMRFPLANVLVVRKVERTLRDSCFSDLKWAINRLGVGHLWSCTTSPLEMVYVKTGQKILFRGLDDGYKITSVSVPSGVLCWLWIEEAYEVTKEDDFDILDESIRGKLPEGYRKRVTVTFNPWSERHWLKKRFFDVENNDVFNLTTTFRDNPYLSDTDIKLFSDMKVRNPRRYRVAGLGEWGVADGLIYENWREERFVMMTAAEYGRLAVKPKNVVISDNLKSGFGLDFGYTNDPTAAFIGFADIENAKIYVWDELYEKGLTNKRIYERLCEKGYAKDRFVGDSAEPKSIDELKGYGLRVNGATKGKDSINNGIQWLQGFEIVIHPRCVNFLTEISGYSWSKDKFGSTMNVPIDDFNHLMDAMRYGFEQYIRHSKWMY